jgi:hypothetical protein
MLHSYLFCYAETLFQNSIIPTCLPSKSVILSAVKDLWLGRAQILRCAQDDRLKGKQILADESIKKFVHNLRK